MRLVVGIGNPGKRYEGTRHNVGFDIVSRLARAANAGPARARFDSLVADAAFAGDKIVLMQPQTYVNDSGRAVKQAVDWYRLDLADVLVVCDDLNLPLGALRLRRRGSSGGHRGIESICWRLDSDEFPRLRVGIGPVPRCERPGAPQIDAVDYVLSRFLQEEREQMDTACCRAVEAIELWIREGIDAAMNQYNRPDPHPPAVGGPDA